MSIYQYNMADDKAHPDFNPYTKKEQIKSNIKPLTRLFDVVDRDIAAFFICLA
jgi:hypothetical protein